MLWSFLAVLFSGWLYIEACYRGPGWQRWLFKPLTLLLLIGLAWQAPASHLTNWLVLAALVTALAGDALLLLPRQQVLYASGAFFLSYLFYAIWFASQKMLAFSWPLPVVLLVIGALLIAFIWRRLEEFRWPVCLTLMMTLVMVWLAGELYFYQHAARTLTLFGGAVLLLLASALGLIRRYGAPFRGDQAIAAACHFFGHFLLVRSLYL